MAFDVIFLPRADADVQGHAAWLHATRSPSAANRWRTGILTKVVLALNIVRHDYCCGVCRAYLDLGSLSLEVKRDLPCPSVKSKAR